MTREKTLKTPLTHIQKILTFLDLAPFSSGLIRQRPLGEGKTERVVDSTSSREKCHSKETNSNQGVGHKSCLATSVYGGGRGNKGPAKFSNTHYRMGEDL